MLTLTGQVFKFIIITNKCGCGLIDRWSAHIGIDTVHVHTNGFTVEKRDSEMFALVRYK